MHFVYLHKYILFDTMMSKGCDGMATTKAGQKAVNKYIANNYDRINITLPIGQKDVWKKAAEKNGLSLNDFIRKCVAEKI